MYSYIRTHSYFVALFILGIGILLVPSVTNAAPCSAPTLNTAYTISANCSGFEQLVHGSDAGITVDAAVTLTVNAGKTIVWAPGASLVINGTIIIESTAKLQQTYLWQQDSDTDGYPDQTRMFTGLTAPGAGYRKRGAMATYTAVDSYPTQSSCTTSTCTIVAFSPDTGSTLATGLVSYWKLDETSGTSASDSKGTNTGTLTNGPTWVAGKLGNGVNLDGANDFVDLGTANILGGTATYSISAWFKTTARAHDDYMVRLSGADAGIAYLAITNADKVTFSVEGTGGGAIESPSSYSNGAWHHVVGVRNAANSYLYVDGVLAASSTGITVSHPATAFTWFGTHTSAVNNSFQFAGVLDEVAMWNKALTVAEVADLYNAGAGNTYAPTTVTAATSSFCYLDSDADTFGASYAYTCSGTVPSDMVTNGTDCNDANAAIYQNLTGYADADADTFRSSTGQQVCSGAALPAAYSATAGTDRNDNDASEVAQ